MDAGGGGGGDQQKKNVFYKQQQQRLQNISLNKELKADDLIKNILEKVDSDAKISKYYNTKSKPSPAVTCNPASSIIPPSTATQPPIAPTSYPLSIPQCFLLNTEIPSIYIQIWNLVKADSYSEFCDRDKLYQVLLLSNLSSNVLAQLWSFVNRTLPGQLTRNEMFVMLALIALTQQHSVDPKNELYNIATIPVPYLTSFTQQDISKDPPLTVPDEDGKPKLVQTEVDEFSEFKCAMPIPSVEFTAQFDDAVIPPANNNCLMDDDVKTDNVNFESKPCIFDDFEDIKPSLDKPIKNVEIKLDGFMDDDNQVVDFIADFEEVKLDQLPTLDSPLDVEDSKLDSTSLNSNHNNNDTNQLETDDKYSILRKLSLNSPDGSGGGDEFGDFYSHSTDNENATQTNEKECDYSGSNRPVSVKRKTLNACKQVMQKTFNILIVSHGEESVLEALSSKDGTKFAFDLHEAFKVASRIKSTLSVLNSAIETEACLFVFSEIEKKWNFIYNIFKKTSINLFTGDSDIDPELDNGSKCVICSHPCTDSTSLLFACFWYHLSCANFWLNFVSSSLPQKQFEDF